MNLNRLITQEDVDGTPDDPASAFVHLISCAEARLTSIEGEVEDRGWGQELISDTRYQFLMITVALAQSYSIEPLASYAIPGVARFDDYAYRQFRADLNHCIMQMMVHKRRSSRSDSVRLEPDTKAKIRSYLHKIREAIDRADLSDARRAGLHSKLSKFEAELEKRQLPLMEMTMIALALLALPGELGDSYNAVSRLVQNVVQVVAEAKREDDENRMLLQTEPPAALLPPRMKPDPSLDDEIPF